MDTHFTLLCEFDGEGLQPPAREPGPSQPGHDDDIPGPSDPTPLESLLAGVQAWDRESGLGCEVVVVAPPGLAPLRPRAHRAVLDRVGIGVETRWPVHGRLVTPGLIDCHTHLVFGGDRVDEFERRLGGDRVQDVTERIQAAALQRELAAIVELRLGVMHTNGAVDAGQKALGRG